jgi:DNA-binding NtrC family response regulator
MPVPNGEILKGLSLLFVEDELLLRKAMGDFLALYFERLHIASNGREALELFQREKPDLVLTDIIMPIMDGISLTEELRRCSPETPVVLYSAFSEVPYLLRGIELGVAGFLPKPTEEAQLVEVLTKAALPLVQRRQLQGLRTELQQSLQQLLGRGERMRQLTGQVARIAPTNFPLLLQGETGTGKSRLAAIIHGLSARAELPFVNVQLGAIPESLVAAELFGHEKGAFTGADRKREGLVATARGGTLFLDDIDAAPPQVQALLLQLADEQSYTPLGSNRKLQADLRIIAASNVDLAKVAAAGRFRQDLYYRLSGLLIEMPPLRAIPEDIPPLAEKFLREISTELGSDLPRLSPAAVELLQHHPWPGNYRELHNVIRRAALLAEREISVELLRPLLAGEMPAAAAGKTDASAPPHTLPLSMAAVERWALQRALDTAGGKKMVAARLLEMNYYTFRRRLARLGLDDGGD